LLDARELVDAVDTEGFAGFEDRESFHRFAGGE
jgi:hypothetical protein